MDNAVRTRGQRGAAAIEYAGIVAVVAALIVTMVVAAPGLGDRLQALLTGNAANTYVFADDEEANKFVDRLEHSALDTLNPLKNPLIALSPAAGIANGISGLFGGPHIGGGDFQLPPSEETFV